MDNGPRLQLIGHRSSLSDCLVMSLVYALGGAALGIVGGFAVAYFQTAAPDPGGWWRLVGLIYGVGAAALLAPAFAVAGFVFERKRGKRSGSSPPS